MTNITRKANKDLTTEEDFAIKEIISKNPEKFVGYEKYTDLQKTMIRKLMHHADIKFPFLYFETSFLKTGWEYEDALDFLYNRFPLFYIYQIFEIGKDGFYSKLRKKKLIALKNIFYDEKITPEIRFFDSDMNEIYFESGGENKYKHFLSYIKFREFSFLFYGIYGKHELENDDEPIYFKNYYFEYLKDFLYKNKEIYHISFDFNRVVEKEKDSYEELEKFNFDDGVGYFSREFCDFTNYI